MRTLDLVYRLAPAAGKLLIKLWYQHMSRLDRNAEMVFMNYGFADIDSSASGPALDEKDEADRYCIQLYHHVAGAVDLEGRDVLEIGCGRGGGASYITRYLSPGSMTGVDVAHKAVSFCSGHHRHERLAFCHGDAEALPFPDNSFDAIVNVESSHCYGSMRRFLDEVYRCLRPDGYFLFADRRDRRHVDIMRGQLRRAGFNVVREQNITRNILRALDLDDERKVSRIDDGVPWFLRKAFKQFAATRGTSLHRAFQNRSWEYLSFVLSKNGRVPAA
jgi:ubiquinone/menaquinone biosynthesis C-methylase UbiE